MMKKFFCQTTLIPISHLILTAITGFVLITFMPNQLLATNVAGIIYSDTFWNLEGSPYNFTGKVQIADDVTLTIEPGVVVNAGNWLEVWGQINANGNPKSYIMFNSALFNPMSSNARITLNYCKLYGCQISGRATGSTEEGFSIKNSLLEGGYVTFRGSNCSVEKSIFINSYVKHAGPGENLSVKNNVFYQPNQKEIYYASIVVDYDIDYAPFVVKYNSFLGVDKMHMYLSATGGNFIATNNYWDTTDTNHIDSMIYDRNDDYNIQDYVIYTPILKQHHPETPIARASFHSFQTIGEAPLPVKFTDYSLGMIISWNWDFGDGSTSSENNPTHTYSNLGSYTVSLSVVDILGLQDTHKKMIKLKNKISMPWTPLLMMDD